MTGPGELVLVATPIGNLGDMSERAIATLASADVVCCEDTRRTGKLLELTATKAKRLLSLHAHNESARTGEILQLLAEGRRVAVVTDAGMPVVSDPGTGLVRAAHDAGYKVSAVPGPSAVTMAVAVSGFGGERWRFEGFLPRKGRGRAESLAAVSNSSEATVVFEAPSRVVATLEDLSTSCGGDRLVTVCRELTKLHEEIRRSTLAEAAARLEQSGVRGEVVLVIEAAPEPPATRPPREELASLVDELVLRGSSRRDAVSEVAGQLGVPRRLVYEAATRPVCHRDQPLPGQ